MRKQPADHRAMLGSAILNLRSRHATSRSSLARALGASASTLSLYVEQLMAEGYVRETGLDKANLGRPRRLLDLVPEAGWFAGLEFNAQRVSAVVVDFSGRCLNVENQELPEGADAAQVLRSLVNLVDKLRKAQPTPLLGIGVGVPGLVDRKKGVGRFFSFIRKWEKVPVAELLHQRFKTSITVENNLRVIALAERWFGGGRDIRDYVILGPRSGFGLAIIHDGQLLHGAHDLAGEVGLWLWPHSAGERAMHDQLSAVAIYRRLAGLADDSPLPSDLRQALCDVADPQSAAWKEVVTEFARVLRSVQLIVDPEVFFLHGPLTSLGRSFCDDVEKVAVFALPGMPELRIRIVGSELGEEAGALGAASLAMEEWNPVA